MIKVFTDGATEGMNGKLGTVTHIGIGIYIPELHIQVSKRLPGISNNEAEYMAVIEAMEILISHDVKDVQFFLDSMIVVNGASRPWKTTNNQRMNSFKAQILELLTNFTSIHFQWIPREENSIADMLSKRSLYTVNQSFYV